jgi:predicted phosphodiesterase
LRVARIVSNVLRRLFLPLRRLRRVRIPRWLRPLGRAVPVLRPVAFAAAGTTLALVAAAHVGASIGPFDTTFSARPGLTGETLIRLAPLGTITLDTHDSPISVEVRVDELRVDAAEAIARDPSLLDRIEDELADDARGALVALAWRTFLFAVAGGMLGGLVARTSWRGLVAGGTTGLAIVSVVGTLVAVTWRPNALAEPRYTGLLTVAPRAVGDAEAIVERFGEYRAQLADLVGNVTALYRAAQDLPTFDPSDRTVRVLHVSDIHLNPQAYDLAERLVDDFDVDAVVDTGDVTDWGTEPESRLVRRIADLDVPYVYVRGNHDSRATQRAVGRQPNAVVLDGDVATVAGIRFFGVGDPRYTPDKSKPTGKVVEREVALGYASRVARLLGELRVAPDVLLVHDWRLATESYGRVPLVLTGHTHEPSLERTDGTVVLTQGSTGGAGLRILRGEDPEPLTASVLYFDDATHRLVAYDQVTVGALEAEVRIERHVVAGEPPTTGTD